MKKFYLTLIAFLFSYEIVTSQDNLYIYADKNILPDDLLKIQVSGYNTNQEAITFEIYRVKDPIKLATSKFDFLNFNDNKFDELSEHFEFISSIQKKFKIKNNWFVETIELKRIREKGTYLVKATIQNKSSYAFFTCSEIGIISKRGVGEVLVFIANRRNSKPLPSQELKLISIDKKIYTLKTDKDGIAFKKIEDRPENRRFFIVTNDNDTTLLLQEIIYSPIDEYDKYLVYTYTNQPVYRPKQKVFFKSIIRERKYDELSTPKKLDVRIKVLMPDNSILLDSNYTTNSFGSLDGSVEIPDEASLGTYTIVVEINGMIYPASFNVEEYKKPEYKVSIETEKENYTSFEDIKIKIKADYFFGKPVQTGKVRLLIYRKPLVRYWWEFEPFAEFYRGCFIDIIPYSHYELLLEKEEKLENGEFQFLYKIDKDIERNYEYQIVAYVKDETNREVQGSHKFLITKNKIIVTTNPDRYFYTTDSKIILKVITSDYSFKPIRKKFFVLIHKVHQINNSEYYEDLDTLNGETQQDGAGFVTYQISTGGKYSYTVIVDDDGKKVTARGDFIVSDKEFKISGLREGLQIIPAKDIFNEADELEFLIVSVFKDVNVFISLEQSRVYEYKVIKLNGNSAIVKFKKELPTIIHITAGTYFDNQYQSAMKKIGILNNKHKLNIEITADKEIYKPGEKGKFKIKVTDHKGKPVINAELSSSIIDESIFSIKSEQSKNIFDVFSQFPIYKILTTNTELPYFFSNRETIDQQLVKFNELKRKGAGIITGKILNAITSEIIPDAEVKLISGKHQITTKTNSKGRFTFRNIPAGIYNLIVDKPFYYKFILPQIKIIEDDVIIKNIKLFPIENHNLLPYRKDFILRDELVLFKQSTEKDAAEQKQSKVELMEGEFMEPVIRKDFRDAIFWVPNLITDQNGEAKIEVTYPDNLTSWRNSIKAITHDSKAGEGIRNVIVRKEILIRAETPRYLHEKDEVILPLMVHNYSSNEHKVKIVLEIINGKIISDYDERMNRRILNPNEILIKPNEAIKLNFQIKADENVDTIFITAKAMVYKSNVINVEPDAVEYKIPVEAIGYPEFIVNNYSVNNNTENISTRINVNEEKRNLKIILKLSPTLIGNLLSSIDELVAYPYGCVEQTMSRFLPAIIVANVIKEIKIDLKQNTLEKLPEVINEGLKRLKDFQHSDGGWGWWKEDQTNPFMTAYVVYGLSMTKKAGYKIEDEMLSKGLGALRNILNGKSEFEDIDAYILYSFSQAIEFSNQPDKDYKLLNKKFDELKKNESNPFILSLLLEISFKHGFNTDINKLKYKLLKSAIVEGNIVYWGKQNFYYRNFFSDPVEITSNAIRSLILCGEKSSLIENAIRWLINQKKGSFWFSTKQTASVILSLSEFIKSSDELNASFVVNIKLNGEVIKSFKFDKENQKIGEINFLVPADELKPGLNDIVIEKSGRGKLYLSVIEKYFKTRMERVDSPFEVDRKYYILKFEKEGDKLVKKIYKLKDEVKVGERILVELKVKTKNDFEYFMLEDPMVPGFERLEEQPEEESIIQMIYQSKEKRDKKTAFFVTNFNKGEYTFSYTTYAQFPGTFTIPPAIASLMYYPEVRAIGEEKVIKVTE